MVLQEPGSIEPIFWFERDKTIYVDPVSCWKLNEKQNHHFLDEVDSVKKSIFSNSILKLQNNNGPNFTFGSVSLIEFFFWQKNLSKRRKEFWGIRWNCELFEFEGTKNSHLLSLGARMVIQGIHQSQRIQTRMILIICCEGYLALMLSRWANDSQRSPQMIWLHLLRQLLKRIRIPADKNCHSATWLSLSESSWGPCY